MKLLELGVMAWPGNYAYLSSFVYSFARLLSAELFMQTERREREWGEGG